MAKSMIVVVLLALAGCANLPPPAQATVSPCAISEASYECQVERYHNINVP